MSKKILSMLISLIFLLSEPLNVFAQTEPFDGYDNPPAVGIGFFEVPATSISGQKEAYLLRGIGGSLWVTKDGIWLTQVEALTPLQKGEHHLSSDVTRGVNIKVTFPYGNKSVELVPDQRMPGHVSILKGKTPDSWVRELPLWGILRYRNLYNGVDLVIRSTESGFAWEYQVQEDAEIDQLRFWVQGAEDFHQDEYGMILNTSLGDLRLPTLGLEGPNGKLTTDKSARVIFGDWIEIFPQEFQVDPKASNPADRLVYSTYLGGTAREYGSDIALDEENNAYIVGETISTDFPVTVGDITLESTDAYISKFNMTTSPPSLAYATYLGGDGIDRASGVGVQDGIAYVIGDTNSSDFPLAGGADDVDVFAVALNETGSDLNYGSLIGGSEPAPEADDYGYAIAVENHNAYLTGISYSDNFPVTNGDGNSTRGDVFAVKINSEGSTVYSTLFGGKYVDAGYGIDVENGIAWITGETDSDDFVERVSDSAVFVINLTGIGLLDTARVFDGTLYERGFDLALDSAGDIYITGFTKSLDFPVTDGSTYAGGLNDAFLLKLNEESVIYATYLGGSGSDHGLGVAVDAAGGVVIVGDTSSTDFPVTDDAFQETYAGSGDAFVTRYFLGGDDPNFRSYSSYLGGTDSDNPKALEMDDKVSAFIVGDTSSTDFPVTPDAFDQSANGSLDAFLSVIVVAPLPAVQIEKYTNGSDSDFAPGEYYLPGTPISWTYDVTNNGQVSLTDIFVTDSEDVIVDCGGITTLDPGESMQCSASGFAEEDQYGNLGTVTAIDSLLGNLVSDVDASHYFGALPDATLLKLTNDQDVDLVGEIYLEPGDNVIWEYVVENTGNVELIGILVTDDKLGGISCPKTSLAAGESMTCTATGKATAGQYENTGSVVGVPPVGPNVDDSDLSHYFGSAPGITIEKLTNGEDADGAPGAYVKVGDPVNWEYVIVNTGNVDLTDIVVTDDMGVTVSCPQKDLLSGESMTCTASGTAAVGQYANLGSVIATPPVGSNVTDSDPSHYFGSEPDVTLEFSVNGHSADTSPGLFVQLPTTLDLVYEVKNTGNVPLYNLVVTDGAYICNIDDLAVDEVDTRCNRQISALSGQQSATASVTANTPEPLMPENDSDPMYYFGATPGLSVDKKTNGQQAEDLPGVYVLTGSTVDWTYDVVNTGNVPLTSVSVVDDMGVSVDCPGDSLSVGGSMQCSASDTAQEGQYTNTATVTGSPPGSLSPIQDSDTSHYFGTTLDVSLDKQTNGDDAEDNPGPYLAVGDPVNWTYTITNNSNVGVSFTISDNPTAIISCPKTTLAISESTICTANDTAEAGQYENTATLTITPSGGLSVFDIQDTSHYFGVTTGIDIQKMTNGQDADMPTGPLIKVGTAINWTYLVTNLSNISIKSIVVTDSDDTLEIDCPSAELGAGAFMTCTASGTAAEGQYSNIGMVNAVTDPAGFGPLTDSDPSHYFGSNAGVEINKLTNDVDIDSDPIPYILVGDPVSWSYIITNVGNLQINEILVSDSDAELVISCPYTTLAPLASMTCTAQGIAQEGEYTNTGFVEAVPMDFTEKVQNFDTSAYVGANPSITIEKFTNGEDADTGTGPYIPVGEQLAFQYEVSSDETLYRFTDISVSDDSGVLVSCELSTFEPGDDLIICSGEDEGVAEIGQQSFSGHVTARAVVVSSGNELGEVSDNDPSHYFGYTPSGLSLTKFTNGTYAEEPPGPELLIGNTVTWTYEVTNESNAPVSNLSVEDDDPSVTVSCDKDELEGNETITCSARGEVAEGQYSNTAQASGIFIPTEGEITSLIATSHYYGVKGAKLFLPMIMR